MLSLLTVPLSDRGNRSSSGLAETGKGSISARARFASVLVSSPEHECLDMNFRSAPAVPRGLVGFLEQVSTVLLSIPGVAGPAVHSVWRRRSYRGHPRPSWVVYVSVTSWRARAAGRRVRRSGGQQVMELGEGWPLPVRHEADCKGQVVRVGEGSRDGYANPGGVPRPGPARGR